MSIIYRKASALDASALLLHISTVGGETDNLSFGADTFNISPEREAKFIDRFARSCDDVMFVALDGEKVVGNAIVERNKVKRYNHRAEISITVLKDYWGQGIGSELMRMMINFAKSVKIESLYLEVRGDNERAISLYKKFEFEKIGEYKGYFKINNSYYDAHFMVLNV